MLNRFAMAAVAAISLLATAAQAASPPQVQGPDGSYQPARADFIADAFGNQAGVPGNPFATNGADVIPGGPNNPVTCTGATYNATTGVITFSASGQNCVIDTQGFGELSFQTSIGGGATFTVTTSEAPTGGFLTAECDVSNNAGTNGPQTGTGSNGELVCNYAHGRYMQIATTAYTSGSPTATLMLRGAVAPSKAVYATLGSGAASIGYTITFTGIAESTTALGASSTFTGTGHGSAGAVWDYFQCRAYSDQAGTLNLQQSDDTGSTWQTAATATIAAAGTSAFVRVNLTGAASTSQWRCQVVNGATAETVLRLTSGFSQN